MYYLHECTILMINSVIKLWFENSFQYTAQNSAVYRRNLVTFTEEIRDGKLHFLYSGKWKIKIKVIVCVTDNTWYEFAICKTKFTNYIDN